MSEVQTTKPWTDEELDELHGSLYAFLSFIDEKRIDQVITNKIMNGHVQALRRAIESSLTEHGGRFYKPQATKVTNGSLKEKL